MAYFTTPAQALVGRDHPDPVEPGARADDDGPAGRLHGDHPERRGRRGHGGREPPAVRAEHHAAPNKKASRTDNLNLQINLVGFPTLAPALYSGTLNLRAVTQ